MFSEVGNRRKALNSIPCQNVLPNYAVLIEIDRQVDRLDNSEKSVVLHGAKIGNVNPSVPSRRQTFHQAKSQKRRVDNDERSGKLYFDHFSCPYRKLQFWK